MWNGFTVLYAFLAVLMLVYSVLTIPLYYIYFARKNLAKEGKPINVTLLEIVRQCNDKFSELSKRSSVLNLLVGLGTTIIVVDGW